jgi:DDE superfamily endonuclease
MIPLNAPIRLVEEYSSYFSQVLTKYELAQFKRYTSGLLLNENKTIESINRLFILDIQDQSTMNRFLTDSHFKVSDLNTARLTFLQQNEQTAFKHQKGNQGVLIIDDTLLTHYGNQFEKSAWLYDHVTNTYTWAHNLVNLHYSDDLTDYPVDFRLWEPADLESVEQAVLKTGFIISENKQLLKQTDAKAWRTYILREYHKKRLHPYKGGSRGAKGKSTEPIEVVYKSKLDYAKDLLRSFKTAYPNVDLPIAFDPWYTSCDLCQFIDKELNMAYVGTLCEKDNLIIHTTHQRQTHTQVVSCGNFAKQLVQQHQQALEQGLPPLFEKVGISYKGKKETYYAYCKNHTTQNLGVQRLIVSFSKPDLSDTPQFYVSNRLNWRVARILRIRRHRWPIETYHEEGKAEGLDKYQVRQFDAVQKHIACVCVTYSMLKRVQFDQHFLDNLQWKPEKKDFSLPFLRRVMSANALIDFLNWCIQQVSSKESNQSNQLNESNQNVLSSMNNKTIIPQIVKAYF